MISDDMQYFKGIGNEVTLAAVVGFAGVLLIVLIKFLYEKWVPPPIQNSAYNNSRRVWTEWLPAWLYQPYVVDSEEFTQRNRSPYTADDTCSICIGTPRFRLETNCGHLFCGACINTLATHQFSLRALRCPLCRQSVSIFYECFSEEERRTESEERNSIRETVQYYNRRFSGQHSSLWSHIRDFPTTLRHMWRELLSTEGNAAHTLFRLRIVLLFAAALLYLASPLDLVPEAAFGVLGLLDDVMVVVILAIYISIVYRRLVVSRGVNPVVHRDS